jgi:hypothetical protein
MALIPRVIPKRLLHNPYRSGHLKGTYLRERAASAGYESLKTGLWAYYPFQDLTYEDKIGNGTDWEADESSSFQLTGGKHGNALSVPDGKEAGEGAKLYQTGSDDDLWEFVLGEAIESFTIRCWFYLPSTEGVPTGAEHIYLLNKQYANGGYGLGIGAANMSWGIRYHAGGGGGQNYTSINVATATISEDVWHYVLVYHNNGVGIGMAFDTGTPTTEVHTDGADASLDGVRIGNVYDDRPLESPHFYIDEVAVWSRVLTGAEITADWNGGAGRFWPNF